MSYIYSNYNLDNKYKMEEKSTSPYIEVLNNKSDIIEVNTMIRFYDIFREYNFIKNHGEIDNILLHILAQIDLESATHRDSIRIEHIKNKISNSYYSKSIKNMFDKINKEDQDIILDFMLLDMNNKQRECLFYEVIKAVFYDSCLLYEKNTQENILYLPVSKNEYNINLIKLIKEIFLDITKEISIIWTNMVGVIGIDELSIMDKMSIY